MDDAKCTYRAEVRVALQKVDPTGRWTTDRLSFEDVTDLGTLDFQQIAELLMRFHNLSQTATLELTGKTQEGS